MLLVRIHYARSVRLIVPRLDRSCGLVPRSFILGTSITTCICICVRPVWSLRVNMYPHCVCPLLSTFLDPPLTWVWLRFCISLARWGVSKTAAYQFISRFLKCRCYFSFTEHPYSWYPWAQQKSEMLLLPFPLCTITDVSVISQLCKNQTDGQALPLFCSCVHCSHAVPLYSHATQ